MAVSCCGFVNFSERVSIRKKEKKKPKELKKERKRERERNPIPKWNWKRREGLPLLS